MCFTHKTNNTTQCKTPYLHHDTIATTHATIDIKQSEVPRADGHNTYADRATLESRPTVIGIRRAFVRYFFIRLLVTNRHYSNYDRN
jgi:hypothetical protein